MLDNLPGLFLFRFGICNLDFQGLTSRRASPLKQKPLYARGYQVFSNFQTEKENA